MRLIDLSTLTYGADVRTVLRIKWATALSVLRRLTWKRAFNLVRSEVERFRGRDAIGSRPLFLKIETTGYCNLDCRWCNGGKRERGSGERPVTSMEFDRFREIVDELGEYLFRINMYGFGEPLLFEDSIRMIRYASDRNISVVVSSNMNLERNPAAELVDSGLERLIFSCHGTTGSTVREFMGGNADLDLALGNVAELLEERRRRRSRYPIVSWQYCVTGFNEHEMEQARSIAGQTGMDEVRFIKPSIPQDAGEKWFSTLFPRSSAPGFGAPARGCSWPWRGAYVACDSGILPCCLGAMYPAEDYGNLEESSFLEVWNGSRYRESRRLIRDPHGYRPDDRIICLQCPLIGFRPESARRETR